MAHFAYSGGHFVTHNGHFVHQCPDGHVTVGCRPLVYVDPFTTPALHPTWQIGSIPGANTPGVLSHAGGELRQLIHPGDLPADTAASFCQTTVDPLTLGLGPADVPKPYAWRHTIRFRFAGATVRTLSLYLRETLTNVITPGWIGARLEIDFPNNTLTAISETNTSATTQTHAGTPVTGDVLDFVQQIAYSSSLAAFAVGWYPRWNGNPLLPSYRIVGTGFLAGGPAARGNSIVNSYPGGPADQSLTLQELEGITFRA